MLFTRGFPEWSEWIFSISAKMSTQTIVIIPNKPPDGYPFSWNVKMNKKCEIKMKVCKGWEVDAKIMPKNHKNPKKWVRFDTLRLVTQNSDIRTVCTEWRQEHTHTHGIREPVTMSGYWRHDFPPNWATKQTTCTESVSWCSLESSVAINWQTYSQAVQYITMGWLPLVDEVECYEFL